MVMLAGCAEDTTDLKQKIAELEKKVAGQEKAISEFAGKQSQVKDFSADIQRLDDQQEKTSEFIKTKVDPINMKLEEFREWAQEAQGERGKVTAKLKAVEQSLSELQKRLDAESKGSARISKEMAEYKKTVQVTAKGLEELSKGLSQVQKEVLDSNTKLLEAVKKTLPKVKTAAVEEIKERLVPLEQNLTSLKTGLETDRKAIEAIRSQPQPGGKSVEALRAKISEIEEIMASQKSYLLEIGSKLHELESAMRGGNARSPFGPPELSRR